jgi:tetratricopeptide (TPR) repeat protein
MAIIEKPYDYFAISNMALAQMSLKEYKDAIHNFKIAIDMKPDLINAKIGLASCYLDTGDIQKAYDLFKSITDGGNYSKAGFGALLYSRQALASWKMGKKDEAIKYLTMADISKVNNQKVLQEIAAISTSMGNKAFALSSYKKLLPVLTNSSNIADVKAKIATLEAESH